MLLSTSLFTRVQVARIRAFTKGSKDRKTRIALNKGLKDLLILLKHTD
jgi:hypothetical protein